MCCDHWVGFPPFRQGVATANQLPPSNPVFCILCSSTRYLHVCCAKMASISDDLNQTSEHLEPLKDTSLLL
ncbi:hypothetical protein OJAV_G00169350 [Oryzias javanicus]|uniref:Uncharacterized protein n=1 Tax=Oryzias javanicus TaxID=123683 RepID=A0A3S2P0M3_ORYJA|nr:hypothetical protein OJAV_G00169350 [Oryzias javanicus]